MSFLSHPVLRDIRFWILALFLLRLIGIANPPLEVGHNWRQTTVTMAARNFLEVDANILYPRIDIAGEKTGITGMEFPILNYLIYLVSLAFGYTHWYGRLINLLFSSVGIYYFYLLCKRYFSQKAALYGGIVLIFSIWLSFSRKIMPDTFASSFILASIYHGSAYLEKREGLPGLLNLLLYILLSTIGILAKLPTAYLLAVFALFIFNRDIPVYRKVLFSLASGLVLIAPLAWYFQWVPYLVETFGFWHFFMGKSIMQGIIEITNDLNRTLYRFYDSALKYVGFIVFLSGIVYAWIRGNRRLLYVLGISLGAFLLIILKAGHTFAHHNYYIIPFVPVMALAAGYALSQIGSKKLVILLLVAIGVEGSINQWYDFRIHDKEWELMQLEEDLDTVSKPSDLILINSGEFPTPMYFAHRKGWVLSNNEIQGKNTLDSLQALGLQHIVIMKKTFGTRITLDAPLSLSTDGYDIYSLSQ